MTKLILLDLYNVLYFPRTNKINTELVEFMQEHNATYSFGILSAVHIDLEQWLKDHELARYFSFVKTTQQLSMSKTEPDVYEMIVSAFELKPDQVLFVDDSAENIAAAKQAGLQTLLFRPSTKLADEIKHF